MGLNSNRVIIDNPLLPVSTQKAPYSGLKPYPPRLKPQLVRQSWQEIYWLSSDGEVVYGRQGAGLCQSTDEWATTTSIGVPNPPQTIQAIRDLDDGELLVSTSRNEGEGIKGKLFKTVGYDRENPANTQFVEVLELQSSQADITNSWGLDVYGNVVVASEYGLRGENGARYVYLSTDHGDTWTTVFDLKETEVEGRPPWTTTAHIHTAAFDPYYSRIWVVVGDTPNTATYYSDNYGADWTYVEGSDVVQYTGIVALEDCVVFGSDRNPNGLHIYRRDGREKHPAIEPWTLVNGDNEITHVFQLPYRRDYGSPVYFNARWARSDRPGHSCLMAFADSHTAFLIYEEERTRQSSVSSGIVWALGPTAQGNVIWSVASTGGPTVYKAPAPEWHHRAR